MSFFHFSAIWKYIQWKQRIKLMCTNNKYKPYAKASFDRLEAISKVHSLCISISLIIFC